MTMPTDATALIDRLNQTGFAICLPFRTSDYNRLIRGAAPDSVCTLPSNRNALLIGNTRAAWPHFLRAWRSDLRLQRHAHPFDTWVEQSLTAVLTDLAPGEMFWGHARRGQRPSLLHAAAAAGMPAGPAFLAAHPRFGPWIALRCVVIPDQQHLPTELPGPTWPGPCETCIDTPCRVLLERARTATAPDVATTGDLGEQWRLWVAVRDACPTGRPWRYSDDQLAYHYAGDRAAIARAAARQLQSSTSSV